MPNKHDEKRRHHIPKMIFKVTNWDQHIAVMAARGRIGWQEETGYGQRSLVETTIGRYK